MKTLNFLYPETHFLFKFPSIYSINREPNFIIQRKCLLNPKNTISHSLLPSCTANSAGFYNGWDNLRIRVDSDELGESNKIKKFLILLGIDDKKYVFTCLLGFVCALAISRVRVSSLVVFPAAAIVFAIGFSFGFVNDRTYKGFGLNETNKRRVKDESLRVYVKNLKNLVDLFDGFDAKVSELKDDIKKARG